MTTTPAPRPNRRSWERRHRIAALLREAQNLAHQESIGDFNDGRVRAFNARLELLVDDAVELEETSLKNDQAYAYERRPEGTQ